MIVALSALWGCWHWRSEFLPVAYLNDSSVHEQMVRFASARISEGHSPLTSWFPYLGLGSPQFLHYQSLGALLAGLLGMAIGPNTAFRTTLYLLLALWPLAIYWSARLFRLSRWVAAAIALMAPLLMDAAGVGYEAHAYVWIGYGVWAQLWASWTLPIAWGFTWRAMTSRTALALAVVFMALTIALHFETGYLAVIALMVFPFLDFTHFRERIVNALAVGIGTALVSAWVVVPLLANGRWAATNEILVNTPLVNGYGAKRVLGWLVTGQSFDEHRLPVISILVAVGFVISLFRWRSDRRGRPIVALFIACLLLSFGRTTFGPLADLLPGSTDIFMRRFMMGVQLSGLYLAGIGAATVARTTISGVRRLSHRLPRWIAGNAKWILPPLAVIAGLVYLSPAWTQLDSYGNDNALAIRAQRSADLVQGRQIEPLLAYVKSHGGGRLYAGMPSNWGATFTVGTVPVFKYVESRDIDEVGYTLRTASLMTDPEYFFDQSNPGDYQLFAIHYLLLPVGRPPPVPAHLVRESGPFSLWVLPHSGYVRVVDVVGALSANRTDVGERSVSFLDSSMAGSDRYLSVSFGGGPAASSTLERGNGPAGQAGSVSTEVDDLLSGRVSAVVVAHRRSAVVLSVSFDPGWTVRVDGRSVKTEMLAPALVAVTVAPGTHRIVYSYSGYRYYPELISAAIMGLVLLVLLSWRSARRGPPGDVAIRKSVATSR